MARTSPDTRSMPGSPGWIRARSHSSNAASTGYRSSRTTGDAVRRGDARHIRFLSHFAELVCLRGATTNNEERTMEARLNLFTNPTAGKILKYITSAGKVI